MLRLVTTLFLSLFLLTPANAAKKAQKETPPPVQSAPDQAKSSETASPALAEKQTTGLSPLLAAAMKIETKAEQAIVIDHHTGKVLFEKNADQPMYPSSLTKIMTAYMIFDRLKKGVVTPETKVMVSKNAWKMQGSKMFLSVDTEVSIMDLLKGIIIQSGNDACTAAAEGLAGTEEIFAAEMTQKAKELGALNTNFKNTSGLPDPEHLSTARDLMIISQKIINDFPEYYDLFAQTEFEYNNIKQQNRNPLLYKNIGCDGLKTGHTDIGKYGLVASAKEVDSDGHEKRIDLVINGLPSSNARSEEAVKLMTWALRTFACLPALKQGQVIENAPVWLGTDETVPLTVLEDVRLVIPQVAKKDIKIDIQYEGPISAPIAKHQQVGKAIVTAPTIDTPIEVPLVAAVSVDKAGFFKRISSSINYLLWGKS